MTGSGDPVPRPPSPLAAPAALLLVDLDEFSSLRSGGPPAVGAVLATVATVLRECVGAGGSVRRWGGGAFVVLLPGAGPTPAARVAERARVAVAGLLVPVRPRRVGGPSVSIGGAVRTGTRPGPTALFWSADAALYEVKVAGGDAVRIRDLDVARR